MKNKLLIIVTFAIITIGITYFLGNNKPLSQKTYKKDGFSITMDKGFIEKDYITFTYYFESTDSVVTTLKEEYELLAQIGLTQDTSNEEYLEFVLMVNELEDNEILTDKNSGIKYIEYQKTVSGKDFYYLAVSVKGEDAFWFCNFACENKNKSKFKDKFLKWADTIEVK